MCSLLCRGEVVAAAVSVLLASTVRPHSLTAAVRIACCPLRQRICRGPLFFFLFLFFLFPNMRASLDSGVPARASGTPHNPAKHVWSHRESVIGRGHIRTSNAKTRRGLASLTFTFSKSSFSLCFYLIAAYRVIFLCFHSRNFQNHRIRPVCYLLDDPNFGPFTGIGFLYIWSLTSRFPVAPTIHNPRPFANRHAAIAPTRKHLINSNLNHVSPSAQYTLHSCHCFATTSLFNHLEILAVSPVPKLLLGRIICISRQKCIFPHVVCVQIN